MEHIVQFAINIDDNKIRDAVVETTERQIINDIRRDVEEIIYESQYNYRNGGKTVDKDNPRDWVKEAVGKVIEENKDQIVTMAVENLARNMTRTKLVRDKIGEVIAE